MLYTDTAAAVPGAMIDVRRISKSYGHNSVLRGVDLQVAGGSSYALLGQNGAGKTTLIRILATLVTPDSGSAAINGRNVATHAAAVRAAISLTGQHAAIDEMLTGRENLVMMGRLRRLGTRGARRRADQLTESFTLTEFANRPVKTYSGGMRRRLDLAASLVAEVPLLFLDEPTTGLDPVSRDQLWGEVRALGKQGTTVLLTTQQLEEADRLADRVGILHGGEIIAEGTPDELKRRTGGEILSLSFGSPEKACTATDLLNPSNHRATRTPNSVTVVEVSYNGTAEAIRALLEQLADAGIPADSLTVQRPSLDDVFADLTGARTDRSAA